jgi:hypothetical protein
VIALLVVGFLLAGIGWAIDNGRVETLGTVMAVAGLALLMAQHWPAR